jgi:hypothetical protein
VILKKKRLKNGILKIIEVLISVRRKSVFDQDVEEDGRMPEQLLKLDEDLFEYDIDTLELWNRMKEEVFAQLDGEEIEHFDISELARINCLKRLSRPRN